jgi:hypothetical protein
MDSTTHLLHHLGRTFGNLELFVAGNVVQSGDFLHDCVKAGFVQEEVSDLRRLRSLPCRLTLANLGMLIDSETRCDQ